MKLLKEITINQKPLTLNQLYKHDRRGFKYKNADHKPFVQEMQIHSKNEAFDIPMIFDIIVYTDHFNNSDVDNYLKALFDSCIETNIIKDDSLIHKLSIEKKQCDYRKGFYIVTKGKDIGKQKKKKFPIFKTIIKIYKMED
jgi:Holliday junction resolvase RusA-like endonuclease